MTIKHSTAALLAVFLAAGAVRAQAPTTQRATPDLPTRRPQEAKADPFAAYDINHDGKLGLAEVKSAAAAHYDELNPDLDDKLDPREASRALQGKAFERADPDHDGTVDKAEYLAALETLFNAADGDHEGTLERPELANDAGQALLHMLR